MVLFAHGSPVAAANEGVEELARLVAERGGFPLVFSAFLDPVRPGLGEAVERAVRAGAGRVVVMPYFLTVGLHLRRDLPRLVAEQRARFAGLEIVVADSLENHPAMADTVLSRVHQALGGSRE